MLKIQTVLCRDGVMDNYSYILQDEESGEVAVIDPSEAKPIIETLEKIKLKPNYVFNTHHHFDHTDANLSIKETYGAKIVANCADAYRIPGFDLGVDVGGNFALGKSCAEIIEATGHTQGHVLWYFPKDKVLFTGDTLFNLCIGGLFEGTIEQMYATLDKIKKLPDDVLFYPGHEYTSGGAQFAYHFFKGNQDISSYLEKVSERLKKGLPAGPVSLGEEKKCNPYLAVEIYSEFYNLF